ncbi:MAG: TrkA C-terminal domain-containing protein [Halobacteriota archaeon]|nr:TrkA C-terminal domain-containing protein [Halobacteriota archaeon]
MSQKEIKYHPENVKDLLKKMKNISELMVDLGYTAVIFENEDIAEEVLRLEEEIDVLLYHARIAAMLGARGIDEAEKLSGVLQIATATENISNAAGDIAKIVLADIKLPGEFKAHLKDAEETITRVKINSESEYASRTLNDLKLRTETGMRVIAIRRGHEWIYNPDCETMLLREDIIFAEGPYEGVPQFYESASKEKFPQKVFVSKRKIDALEEAADLIIDMKDTSELAVGLAYTAVLFYSKEIALEVELLENQMDLMRSKLESLVLKAAKDVDDTESLKGLLQLATSSEVISDAAYGIADIVLRDIELHPVFMLALRESDEVITRVNVEDNSELIGNTLGNLKLETETGMFVLAIRRSDKWIYHPGAKTIVREGDSLIAMGTRSGEELLFKMSSEK